MILEKSVIGGLDPEQTICLNDSQKLSMFLFEINHEKRFQKNIFTIYRLKKQIIVEANQPFCFEADSQFIYIITEDFYLNIYRKK